MYLVKYGKWIRISVFPYLCEILGSHSLDSKGLGQCEISIKGVRTELEANVGSGDKSHLITGTPEHLLMLKKGRCLWWIYTHSSKINYVVD